MMTFLLQFFLNYQCIDQYKILKWYNHRGSFRYEGFDNAKQLAKPFIESLNNTQTVSTNPISVDQSSKIEVKQEPVSMT
jgi:hypothetical protein